MIYSSLIILKSFISLVFFLSIFTFLFKKINLITKVLHVLMFFILLLYNYCVDFQIFLTNDFYKSLSNTIFILKNNVIIYSSSFYETLNFSHNNSNFHNTLLMPVSFFNVKLIDFSFISKIQFEFFYLQVYNYFLIVF